MGFGGGRITFSLGETGRPWEFPGIVAIRSRGFWIGQGHGALEVVLGEATSPPASTDLVTIWRKRQAGRATPILFVVKYPNEEGKPLTAVCGPIGESPPIHMDIEPMLIERICKTALNERDRHTAIRFLNSVLPDATSPLPGLRNEGFLATHELRVGVVKRPDWHEVSTKARVTLDKTGKDLVRSLGFSIQDASGPISFLLAGPRKVAIAAFLDQSEVPEMISERFMGTSPVTYALGRAEMEGLPYVVITAGSMIRVHPVRHIGVGQRGRTETFIEAHLGVLPVDKMAYLWYLFSSEALAYGGYLEGILDESRNFIADLGRRLRERVYDQVIPNLSNAIALARGTKKPTREDLTTTYQMSLTVLFRLLFVAYGEDKELLPYRTNMIYQSRSLKRKAQEILGLVKENKTFDSSFSHWEEIFHLFDAINDGRSEWGVPSYDGGLLSSDEKVSVAGARLKEIKIPNSQFGPILQYLLLDDSPEGLGPVDFRSLGVREFGTIYEGLLESELAVAETDLALDQNGLYRPVKNRDKVVIKQDKYYLTNTSGARKSTGSFFTKAFAVEHLLDNALEPALDIHIARLDGISDDDEAGKAFFDFKVIDIAMGSGHFLVSAIDRIEKKFLSFLMKRPLPTVFDELSRLRSTALKALGTKGEESNIEDAQLLRRQIARRCIYGVDLNPLAVDLSRVSIWIHTFVPGLPLSLLDAHLVEGNSLVGIATVTEAENLLGIHRVNLFSREAKQLMKELSGDMRKVGRLADATVAEVRKAREEWEAAKKKAAPWAALMDILAASRIDQQVKNKIPDVLTTWSDNPDQLLVSWGFQKAKAVMKAIPPFHFPVAFPEVFFETTPGFNVVLGNPPWEEATIEEDKFWGRFSPGLSGLPQHAQEALKAHLRRTRPDLVQYLEKVVAEKELLRTTLTTSDYPGMGSGDPDLYKAFCWRFWHLLADRGHIGVVLPRSALSAMGSGDFRKTILKESTVIDLTFLLNNGKWVFEEVHPQYTIALVSIKKETPSKGTQLPLKGPFTNLKTFLSGKNAQSIKFSVSEVFSWNDSAALPLLPSEESLDVFTQLRKAPRLDMDDGVSWSVKPYRELDATNDRKLMVVKEEKPEGYWPVFKGETFDIWQPDTGSYYAWIDPKKVRTHLHKKRLKSSQLERSAFRDFPKPWLQNPDTLPCLFPRIAFRDVTNRTNRRTVIAALIPPNVVISNQGPTLVWKRGDEKDQAFLLGVLCSIPLDWYARRFVETHVNFHIFNPFPIPRPPATHPLCKRIIELAGRLACPDDRFAGWGKAIDVEVGPISQKKKDKMIYELDAVVAHLYGLSKSQLSHIFETFHEGWDFADRLTATLKYYHQWEGKF